MPRQDAPSEASRLESIALATGFARFQTALWIWLIAVAGVAQPVRAQTQEMCPGPIPEGWVQVGVVTCAGCCGSPGKQVDKLVIKRISDSPPGAKLTVCPQPTPSGWVVVGSEACAGCCGAALGITHRPVIEKIDGMPVGATVDICPQPIPKGWVAVSVRDCAGCCGNPGQMSSLTTIKRLNATSKLKNQK